MTKNEKQIEFDGNEMPHKLQPNERQTGSLAQRWRRVPTSRRLRFALVIVLYLGWTLWMGNPWLLLALPLLADLYLFQFVDWAWWKRSKSPLVRTVMGWVDAISYAVILVYFIFAYLGQNYQIPSSSLEKTLLTGDFLWVNKMVYGPRVPQTPLHFPLVQNELFGFKSYIESWQLPYHRLKGLRKVERGDIVVFNYPAGDTVATKMPNPDYYTLVHQYGREAVWGNPDRFGKIVYRPVDRRDNYVKRCLGLPGEWLSIKDGTVYINGKALQDPKNVQYMYAVMTEGNQPLPTDVLDELNISNEARSGGNILPLTAEMVNRIRSVPGVIAVHRITDADYPKPNPDTDLTYPVGVNYGWTHNNYGPILIPKRGMKLQLTAQNLPLYARCITAYEGNRLDVKGNQIFINGQPAQSYTFKMDYYWMEGDNRDNSLDSRYWGFVPEDHIVGTPMFVIISFDQDRINGWVRWNRIFKSANPDK